MDTIFISGLKADTIIGIYDWEKNTRQTILLDLEMATDISKAAASDDIEDTLNYKSISKRLVDFIENSKFELVEKLAEEISTLLIKEFGVQELKLTLHKPGALSDADDVGIKITRRKS